MTGHRLPSTFAPIRQINTLKQRYTSACTLAASPVVRSTSTRFCWIVGRWSRKWFLGAERRTNVSRRIQMQRSVISASREVKSPAEGGAEMRAAREIRELGVK